MGAMMQLMMSTLLGWPIEEKWQPAAPPLIALPIDQTFRRAVILFAFSRAIVFTIDPDRLEREL